MFIDAVTVTLSAGKGGNGVVAWRREKYIPKGGPVGGNGGNGANIVLYADHHTLSLEGFRNKRIIKAENGQEGGGALKQGRKGRDLVLNVPAGTLVKNADTGEVLFDFTKEGQEWIVCKGGRGGKGNATFKSPTHQAPNIRTEGTEGVSLEVALELKLIADIGLIGFPNAGKSTLLTKLTHVPVKVGAYPFTTLSPNLGFIQYPDYSRVLIADIPGIIENAHLDKGLGLEFLKHIERTKMLVYVIDISGFEARDPFSDFEVLQEELRAYRADIRDKPFLVVLNKTDVEGAQGHIASFRKRYPFPPSTLFELSALNNQGTKPLLDLLKSYATFFNAP